MKSRIKCRWEQTKRRYRLQQDICTRHIMDISKIDINFSNTKKWTTKQLDFVQAFLQAPVEQELYIDIPKGCIINGKNTKDYVLRVLKNIYGKKQAGKVCYDYLIEGLTQQLGFVKSIHDPCNIYR
jgi:Reverse transcriptase (RNA-dependent DNA polymerase)